MLVGPPPEITLEGVERRFLPEIALVEVERARMGPMERALLADVASRTVLRIVFTFVVLALFVWLNYQVMNLVRDIFAETKRLDKEIVMALVGGTVTQIGLITFIMARFLFPLGERDQGG